MDIQPINAFLSVAGKKKKYRGLVNSNPADRQSLLKNMTEILQTHKRDDTLSTDIVFKNDKRFDEAT
jgi:hypothetical protein